MTGYRLTPGELKPKDEKTLNGFKIRIGGVFEVYPVPNTFKDGDKFTEDEWKKIKENPIRKNDIKEGMRVFVPDVMFGGAWSATVEKVSTKWNAIGKDIITPLSYDEEDDVWGFNAIINAHSVVKGTLET